MNRRDRFRGSILLVEPIEWKDAQDAAPVVDPVTRRVWRHWPDTGASVEYRTPDEAIEDPGPSDVVFMMGERAPE